MNGLMIYRKSSKNYLSHLGNFLDVMHGTNAVHLRSITIRLWKKIFREGENIRTLSLSETVPGGF